MKIILKGGKKKKANEGKITFAFPLSLSLSLSLKLINPTEGRGPHPLLPDLKLMPILFTPISSEGGSLFFPCRSVTRVESAR